MAGAKIALKAASTALRAVTVTTVKRLVRRPLHPHWSWATECAVRGARTFVANNMDSLQTLRFVPPTSLPSSLRKRVDIAEERLGGRPVEVHTPAGWREGGPTCLYLHGGGYVTCSPTTHRLLVARLAVTAQLRCYALDYRLAPEHPYPAALEDVCDAVSELVERGVARESLWLAGDSAGGGLCVASMLRWRASEIPMPRGAMLLSPWLDLAATGASIKQNAAYDYLPEQILHSFADCYRGDAPVTSPEISPARAALHGLAPMLVLTGGLELFLSENIDFVDKCRAAGVAVRHEIAPHMVHVYPALLPLRADSRAAFRLMSQCVQAEREGHFLDFFASI